jgi:hypothetical protein
MLTLQALSANLPKCTQAGSINNSADHRNPRCIPGDQQCRQEQRTSSNDGAAKLPVRSSSSPAITGRAICPTPQHAAVRAKACRWSSGARARVAAKSSAVMPMNMPPSSTATSSVPAGVTGDGRGQIGVRSGRCPEPAHGLGDDGAVVAARAPGRADPRWREQPVLAHKPQHSTLRRAHPGVA